MGDIDLGQEIMGCTERFKKAPRSISFWKRWRELKIKEPPWLEGDKLTQHFRALDTIWTDGIVTWGTLVQANMVLFEVNEYDAPGEVVFARTRKVERIDVGDLYDAGRAVAGLKGTSPSEPGQLALADHLTDERTRMFGAPVPMSLSPNLPCCLSTTYFCRKHLPGRRLCAPLFPILVLPRKPMHITMLPGKYWTTNLRRWWREVGTQ